MPANRPSAAELLIAVREFLEQDIKALLASVSSDASDRDTDRAAGMRDIPAKTLMLNNSIAINMLKLLEREQHLRCKQQLDEQAMLRGYLGCTDTVHNPELAPDFGLVQDIDALNAQLISVIEAPEFVDAEGRLLQLLQQISLSKLAIDNPQYSTFRKLSIQ